QKVTLARSPLLSSQVAYDYDWDELGRLSSASRTRGGLLVAQESFGYDSTGKRVRITKSVPGPTVYTQTVFSTLTRKNASYTNGFYQDDASTENVYLAQGMAHVFNDTQQVLPTQGGNQTHAYLEFADPRGSTAFVIDYGTGELVERTTHQAYGAIESD